jgi:hypothetical protein
MKKTALIITAFLLLTSCGYEPMDLTYKTIPAKVLEYAQVYAKEDTTISPGDLFIIPDPSAENRDFIFMVDPKNPDIVAIHAIYPTNDPGATGGVAGIVTGLICLGLGILIGYRIYE